MDPKTYSLLFAISLLAQTACAQDPPCTPAKNGQADHGSPSADGVAEFTLLKKGDSQCVGKFLPGWRVVYEVSCLSGSLHIDSSETPSTTPIPLNAGDCKRIRKSAEHGFRIVSDLDKTKVEVGCPAYFPDRNEISDYVLPKEDVNTPKSFPTPSLENEYLAYRVFCLEDSVKVNYGCGMNVPTMVVQSGLFCDLVVARAGGHCPCSPKGLEMTSIDGDTGSRIKVLFLGFAPEPKRKDKR